MTQRENPEAAAFERAASQFCRLLESTPADRESWIEQVTAALAMLYACGHMLVDLDTEQAQEFDKSFDVQDDEWRQVFRLVSDLVGEQRYYWAYFDPSEPLNFDESLNFGNLADDLADIYRDVKPGLRVWQTLDDAYLPWVVVDWKFMLASHWGVHAVSAMRALHPLALLRGLGESDAL